MKKLAFLLPALLLLLLPGCTKDSDADASGLFAAVPSDATAVTVVNLAKTLEKVGCKISDTSYIPSEALVNASRDAKTPGKEIIALFAAPDNGIQPSAAVVTRTGYYTYISGIASDPAKLRNAWQAIVQDSFRESEGIAVSRNLAVKGNMFWISVGKTSVDPEEIKHFATLSEDQSFLSTPQAKNLTEVQNDIKGWGDLTALANSSDMDFQQRAAIQVFSQTILNDPHSIIFSVDFGKTELRAEASVCDSKGNPAKYLLPAKELDINTVQSIGGNASMLLAVSLPSDLIEGLKKDTKSKAPSMLGLYLDMLAPLDGTCALAGSITDEALRGVLTVNNSSLTPITSLLSQSGFEFVHSGKVLTFGKGTPDGPLDVAATAKDFKGATAAFAIGGEQELKEIGGSAAVISLHPSRGSVLLKVKVTYPEGTLPIAGTLNGL